MTGTGSA